MRYHILPILQEERVNKRSEFLFIHFLIYKPKIIGKGGIKNNTAHGSFQKFVWLLFIFAFCQNPYFRPKVNLLHVVRKHCFIFRGKNLPFSPGAVFKMSKPIT